MKSVPVTATCTSWGCGELPYSFRDSLIGCQVEDFTVDHCSKIDTGFSAGRGYECWKIKYQEKWGHIKEKKMGHQNWNFCAPTFSFL